MSFYYNYALEILETTHTTGKIIRELVTEDYVRYHTHKVFSTYASDKFDESAIDIIADIVVDGAYDDVFVLDSIKSKFSEKELGFMACELYQLEETDVIIFHMTKNEIPENIRDLYNRYLNELNSLGYDVFAEQVALYVNDVDSPYYPSYIFEEIE